MAATPVDPHVGLVVEGAGDVTALPILLRAHLHATGEFRDVLGKPVALHGRTKAFVANGIEGYVAVAALRPGCIGVLVVLDGEGDCVAHTGPTLKARADRVSRVPVRVALADHDFEDWLYASAETLALPLGGHDGTRRGQHMIKQALKPRSYTKPVWQPSLASRVDLALARPRSASLDRCLRRFDELRLHLPPSG